MERGKYENNVDKFNFLVQITISVAAGGNFLELLDTKWICTGGRAVGRLFCFGRKKGGAGIVKNVAKCVKNCSFVYYKCAFFRRGVSDFTLGV